ncbi:hypothetical protein MMC27_004174 [Xylographa pallens]|nr:hypothetical protein [Xylographa pallens]
MADAFNILLFGDGSSDFREPLQKLCERQKGVIFLHFLDRLNEVLRDEARRQPRHVRQQIPPFTDVFDLVKKYQDAASRNQILDTTLACICQLGSVISFFDDHPSQFIVPSDTVLVGLCTGLLAATAVSASQNILDLIANALKFVRVAFRIGAKVNDVAQRLSTINDAQVNPSWSRLVVGVQKEASVAEVTQFNDRKALPRASHAYISSNSRDVVTISGPPATIRALFLESDYFRQRKTVPLDIFGPFHASHLYSDADVEEIVQSIAETKINLAIPSIRVISGITETSRPNVGMDQFLRQVVGDILIRPLSLDQVLSAVVSEARDSGRENCKISSVGPSKALSSMVSALRAGTEVEVSVGEQLGLTKPAADPSGTSVKIAVVGMSGRFPNADNLESLWSVLEQGLDVHRRVPPDRFDIDAHYDPTGKRKNTSHTPYGCFVEEPGLFDPRFFNMSPREAYQTDPMGRLALVTAYEALEMSGFIPNRTPSSMLDRVGTFYGQTSDDWRQVNAAQNIDTYYIPGTIRAFASGRINYYFKFKGPSYNVDTACSSSFAAIQLACTSLQAKECDTAVAGGLNIMTTPDLFAGLSRAQFLSKTGSCKTFDDSADGFCRGDSVATVILKRLEDAEADNDPILGVILGTATNHSSEAVSITQPHAPTQETLYRKILRKTGIDARDVSYVEMHGTGTQAGDGAEMRSISNVFAPRLQGRLPGQTLHLGALKANIGHGEASAGVSSLIKVLLMLQRNAIPPHVGIKGTMNTTFPTDLEERGIRIPLKETPWLPQNGGKRRAYVNNFSAAGGNTGLLLEDAPKPVRMSENGDPRTTFVVSVTAKSAWSLQRNIQKLISYLEMKPDTSLSRLSYTTTARRTQQPYRISFPVSSVSEAKEALRSAQAETIKPVSVKPPKVAFVFTGQGAHYTSLGKQLFDNSRQFRSDIIDFDRIGRSQGFATFLPLLDGTITDATAFPPFVLQLGQTCIQMALARLWISWGILPSVVLGHSLGEYAALNVAGVLSVSDTIFLVGRRAELLAKHCTAGTHALLAAATSVTSIREVLVGDEADVACINGPRETVISGPTEQLMSYSKTIKAAGIKSVLLPCAYAFHSAQVTPILEPLKELASSITFANPAIPVISPMLQGVVTGGDVFGPEYLARHARQTVGFLGGITAAKEDGLVDQSTIWIEIGPAPVCSTFIKSSLGTETVTVPSLRKKEDPWKTMSSGLSVLHRKGLHIDWDEVHREYESSHTVLSLPRYTFENKNYWLEYTNNWCLNKGEVLEAPAKRFRDRRLSTSAVQKLVKEDYGDKITLVAESDLSDPDLNDAMSGHLVNGAALCPSGVYADMALTLAGYLHRKLNKSTEYIPMDVRQLEIIKPLIAKGRDSKEQPVVRITATAERPLGLVKISYNSVSQDGSVGDLHASCVVEYGDTKSWLADWSRMAYLIRSRIDVLAQGADVGKYKKVSRGQAYEAFASLVQYGSKYHGMKEVILDSKNFEATSFIEFRATESDGDFEVPPYWIDNIAHLSGFILNGSDAVDSTKQVYISHGWESLQIVRPLSARRSYRNHVKMHRGPKQTMVGDVYVFDGDDMVALVGGVKFQAIPRSLLNKLLPPINGAAAYPKAQVSSPTNGIASQPKAGNPKIEKQPAHVLIETPHKPTPSISHPQNGNASVITEFMSIIAGELGLEPSELHDGAAFADVGLDSLMSLTITGRMREELEIDVPTSLFVDNTTIGEAKAAILALDGDSLHENASPESASTSSAASTDAMSGGDLTRNTSIGSAMAKYSTESTTEKLLSIISEELGIEQSELLEMGSFADMGVDSLMSLTISGRVREELEVDIPTSFFADYPTLSEAKIAISALMGTNSSGGVTPSSYTENTTPGETDTAPSSQDPDGESLTKLIVGIRAKEAALTPATSILLSGSPKTASKTLFLFPDGSGSATSYALLPSISPDVCVYGLNCPFMKSPADYTNGIEGVSAQYLTEIKRRQPHGPYYLGGWSAGGVIAYQVAYKLLEMGEKTERLFLIDSPCPINLEPLPSSLLHFVDSMGLLGTQKSPPDWLIPHFEASIVNLAAYAPCPMDPLEAPKTLIIWARDGLCKDPKDQTFPRSAGEAKSVKFLLDNRLDLGPKGWEKLVGEENILTMPVQGNHFTMIRDPDVKQVAALLRRGLGVH